MTNKRILLSVLAMATFGVSARASVLVYCDTPASNCGVNTMPAFETAVIADSYTYASVTDITFTVGNLSGGQYLDSSTQVLFAASSALAIAGITLEETAQNIVTINIPAAYAAIRFSVSQREGGNDYTYLDAGDNYNVYLTSTPQEIGYINQTPGSPWVVTLTPLQTGEKIQFDSFDPAGAQSPTPEVGTLLLIGAGLIAMRWMKRLPRRSFRALRTQTA